MKQLIKSAVRRFAWRMGYDIVRFRGVSMGVNPIVDMQQFLKGQGAPLILDVGANDGKSIDAFKRAFPDCTIHSFEPSPTTYEQLQAHCCRLKGVTAWNLGVGSCNSTLQLQENERSVMSSFLSPGEVCGGRIVRTTDVQVVTLDSFCMEQDIDFIHVLKSDTQGFDFEVLKGAGLLMKENRIGLIYFEFTFSEMYKGLPSFHEVFGHLLDNNFALVGFYEFHYLKKLASWTNVLFVNREYYSRCSERATVEQQNV